MIDIIQGVTSASASSSGYQIIQGSAGPQGPTAQSGLLFAFSGLILSAEYAMPGAMPAAGTFSASNSVATSEIAASAPSVFLTYMRPPGGSFTLFATTTFSPSGAAMVFSANAYPAGAYFKTVPPSSPDASLYGAAILFGGP